ncbi:flagellar basal body rod protein [Cellulomonas sp. JZ18]|uniref:flagellar basal body-associated FliL family protein n=1 Tax=Cellulomonas sp. JZ18 TaxID=2654191 RepID=UPI0012D3A587|nr:flagellar basal body-associated FliL family protein [Cellulomonas sp. JZ18]QGQ20296.1 flagellar basal body rod protein [Cellulomonas sp. JZ18]
MSPVEQRVVSSQKIGARPQRPIGASAPPPPVEEPKPSGKRRRLLLVLGGVVVLLVVAAAAWFLFLRPQGGEAAHAPEPAPEPGEVVQVEPVSLNLADGHYLRIGLGLQLTADAHGAPDPSRAVDAAIALYSGRTVAEVQDPATRDALKAQLAATLAEVYEGEVMDVYLTSYVTQ